MQMNLPNKLTVLRVLMIPFFVLFMLVDITGAADKWIAVALFVAASLTDFQCGHDLSGRNGQTSGMDRHHHYQS